MFTARQLAVEPGNLMGKRIGSLRRFGNDQSSILSPPRMVDERSYKGYRLKVLVREVKSDSNWAPSFRTTAV